MQPQNWNKAVIQNLQDMIINQSDTSIFLRQSQKLKVLLTIPPKERTDGHIKEISVLVQGVKFLSRYREKPYYNELCRNLYVKTFQQKKTIFKQGDKGTCFYVIDIQCILNGIVKIYANEPSCFPGQFKKREIAVLGKGNCFGEIALFFGSLRTATVIAESECDLLMLDREVFQQYIQGDSEAFDLQSTNLKDVRHFLKKVQQFQFFTSEEITQINSQIINDYFKIRCCIIYNIMYKLIQLNKQKLNYQIIIPKSLFIIKSGRVRVIKKLEIGTQYYELDELEQGSVFGDRACITNIVSEYTYITSMPSEVIQLNGFDLKQYVSQDNLNKYVESIRLYPEPETLCQMQVEDLQWKEYRENLMIGIIQEVVSSKQDLIRECDYQNYVINWLILLISKFIRGHCNNRRKLYISVLRQSCRTPQHKQLFPREIESLRNQISPKRMKQFEQNYL